MERIKDHHKSVFGIYKSRTQVEKAVDMLRAAQFRHSDISVLLPSKGETERFAHEKATKAPEGVTAGATAGAVIGGSLGWLVGIGALAIPGVGPLVAAGPIAAALAGLGFGGAVGGISGALVGMGFPEYEAKRFAGKIEKGGILLSVHTDDQDWLDRAEHILQASGAEDVSSTGEVGAEENPRYHTRDGVADMDSDLYMDKDQPRDKFAPYGRGIDDVPTPPLY